MKNIDIKIKKITLILDNKNWIIKKIDNNKKILFYKYMNEYNFYNDLNKLKELEIPYIYYEENSDLIIKIELSCGIVRSIPLFYYLSNDEIIISDNIQIIENYKKINYFEKSSIEDFLIFGYALGNNTLIKDIKQIQAGEILNAKIGSNLNIKNNFLYLNKSDEFDGVPIEELNKKYENLLYSIFDLYIKNIGNRLIILPLSGGYDSRLILSMFKEFNVKNVLCFTYGLKNNYESIKAKKVADILGYNIEFIEYSVEKRIELYDEILFQNFFNYASKKNSLAVTQEYIFVKQIKDKYKYLNKDIVFFPGHTGDFVSGGHIPFELLNSTKEKILMENIFSKHQLRRYSFNKNNVLKDYFFNIYDTSILNKFEFFNWRERQSKFIVNANRTYDFFDYGWYMPFWNEKYVKFWLKMPLKYKYQKNFFDQYLENILFEKLNINFDKEERINRRKKGNRYFYLLLRNKIKNNDKIKYFYRKNIVPKLKNKLEINPIGSDKIGIEIIKYINNNYFLSYKKVKDNFQEIMSCERTNPNAYPAEYYISKLLKEYNFYGI